MKKGLLLVVVMLATIAVKAQDIYVGGSLNVWRNSTGNTTSFKIAPEIGYNFNETWALGAELDYSHNYDGGVTKNSVFVAPYIRWSYCETGAVRLFLDGTAAVGFVKVKDGDTSKAGQVGLRPGIAVKLNDHFSFIAKYVEILTLLEILLVFNLLAKTFQLVSTTHSDKKKSNSTK